MKRARVLLVLVVVAALATWATAALAGDLNPPASAAPGGVPAPTMKTLDQIPGAWDRTLSAVSPTGDPCSSPRFKCVLGGEAVLDRETGLVWERCAQLRLWTWHTAVSQCYERTIGGRLGWRLPSAEELATLVDPSTRPALPPGHPFQRMDEQGGEVPFDASSCPYQDARCIFWTSTVHPVAASAVTGVPFVYYVHFNNLGVGPGTGPYVSVNQGNEFPAWCVRGGRVQPPRVTEYSAP